eukprot:TRINITY_DN41_c0_g1_i11.p1 TRINITY_DN41_c0_g1~~TRINITY_DN41_c0_g1_i11.p1  ORF type:complete len:667 (-),score=232.04 TRINITY_DN41_c0_g1_i11:99-2099(-)
MSSNSSAPSQSELSDMLHYREPAGTVSEEADFNIVVRDIKVTDLASRNRFRDKLKIVIDFDGTKLKTKKQVISGAGDAKWKGPYKCDYHANSYKRLDDKNLILKLMKSKTEEVGRISVDLWTLATGPKDHNLPIQDPQGRPMGRLQFSLDMEEVSNVAVLFKEIKLRNLKAPSGSNECHPYLKYAYSKNWPVLDDGKKYAVYSTVQYNNKNPEWFDLPEVRFKASLRELLSESIVLHVTHSGSVLNTTLGRCNLLFRTLVDNGKTFKESDLISFKGPLKIDNAEIQGILIFRFLPRTAQMKPVNAIKKAVHTEKGIHDALPLLPHLPLPKKPMIRSDERTVDTLEAGGDSPSITKKRTATFGPKSVFKDGTRSPKQVYSPEMKREFTKAKELEDAKKTHFVEDLISLDTPPNLRRSNKGMGALSPSLLSGRPQSAISPALLGSGALLNLPNSAVANIRKSDPFAVSYAPASSYRSPSQLHHQQSNPFATNSQAPTFVPDSSNPFATSQPVQQQSLPPQQPQPQVHQQHPFQQQAQQQPTFAQQPFAPQVHQQQMQPQVHVQQPQVHQQHPFQQQAQQQPTFAQQPFAPQVHQQQMQPQVHVQQPQVHQQPQQMQSNLAQQQLLQQQAALAQQQQLLQQQMAALALQQQSLAQPQAANPFLNPFGQN